MTLPGKMLGDSVDRLAQTINAAKDHSDRLKAESLGAPVTPVAIEEVTNERRSDREQNPA